MSDILGIIFREDDELNYATNKELKNIGIFSPYGLKAEFKDGTWIVYPWESIKRFYGMKAK